MTTTASVSRVLTPRQFAILVALADGCGQDEVAHQLGMRTQTLKNHMTEIRHRLGVPDGLHLVAVYRALGWLTVPDEPVVPYSVRCLTSALDEVRSVLAEMTA